MRMRNLGCLVLSLVLTGSIFLADVGWTNAAEPKSAEPKAADAKSAVPKPAVTSADDLVPQPEPDEAEDAWLIEPRELWGGGASCDDACRACLVGPPGRHWFRTDYLLWWTRGAHVVPLVTTGDQGVIGNEGTEILFGDERVNGQSRSNVRLSGGFWLDCCRTKAIEVDAFWLGNADTNFSYLSFGSPLLARPFYNIVAGGEAAELVSHPDYLAGKVDGRIGEDFFSGGVALRCNLCCYDPCCTCGSDCGSSCGSSRSSRRYRVDLIAGYRSHRLDDSLRVHEFLQTTDIIPDDPLIPVGTQFHIKDAFRSRNEFHGGELGVIAQFFRGCWSLDLLAKVGLGNNHQVVSIYGNTIITTPDGTSESYDAGILALDTNSDVYSRNEFAAIPQLGAEIGLQVTCNLRAHVGYNFIYWADVVRGPEQVDYAINPGYIPPVTPPVSGPERPAFDFNESDFWAHGLNAGLEWRF